jgi:hypothetical protein
MVGAGCTTPGMHHALQQNLQAPNSWPKTLAVYMPWFGDHVHMDVGYSSYDPAVLRKQIQQARHMGISAFAVDWYGKSNPFSDHNFALLQEATDEAMAALDEAYKSYIGPEAMHRGAYLTYNGHPMIFIFPKRGHVDWNRVIEHCSGWDSTPLLFYKDEPPAQYSSAFAGLYPWVQPGQKGWTSDGNIWMTSTKT